METPLSPLDFARRTRRLHGDREAVGDGALRLTYAQFFDRCDRWSSALQGLGVTQGDRVATIAPNTHAQLEAFYAVPQLGAVLVPINYRLTPEDFVYIVNHSGATVVCAAREYLAAVDGIRDQMPDVKHFVAFEGTGDGWLDYEAAIAAAGPDFERPVIDERDLLTINYTSGTTARPKGVMITHRNAAMNTIGTLLHLPIAVGERYLWTLPMFHANGWTYTWTVTAAAGVHVCLPKVDPAEVFRLIRQENVRWLSAAPTVLISLASAPAQVRGEVPPGAHVVTAGAPPPAPTALRPPGRGHVRARRRGMRVGGRARVRADRDRAVHHGLRPAARARGPGSRRPGRGQGPPGRRTAHLGRTARGRPGGHRGGARRPVARRDRGARQRGDGGLLPRPGGDRAGDGRRLVPHRRRRRRAPRRLHGDPRPDQGRDHQRRREHLVGRGGGHPVAPPRRPGGRDRRTAPREVGRGATRVHRAARGRRRDRRGTGRVRPRPARPLQGPARRHVRHRTAQDRDRQDPEVRPPQQRPQPDPPIGPPFHDRGSLYADFRIQTSTKAERRAITRRAPALAPPSRAGTEAAR